MWLVGLYLLAAVAANLSVSYFGPSVAIFNAFALIGLDLTTRDALHEKWHGKQLMPRMVLLIASGSALSAALNWNAAPIALASMLAFAAAASSDTLIYYLLGDRARLVKMNGSNVVSSAVDSLIFPLVAFGWPPLWPIMAGQFVAKVAGGFVWSLVLNWRRPEATPSFSR